MQEISFYWTITIFALGRIGKKLNRISYWNETGLMSEWQFIYAQNCRLFIAVDSMSNMRYRNKHYRFDWDTISIVIISACSCDEHMIALIDWFELNRTYFDSITMNRLCAATFVEAEGYNRNDIVGISDNFDARTNQLEQINMKIHYSDWFLQNRAYGLCIR